MKTRSSVSLALAAGTLLLAAACSESDHVINPVPAVVEGDGNAVEESRAIGACSSIDHSGVGDLYIEQGAHEQLRIRAEENLLEYLHTDVQSGELVIWKDGVTLLNTRPIEYHLTVVNLDRAALTGAGQIRGSDLDTGPLELLLSGVGTVELLNLSAPILDIEGSGLGSFTLSGAVQEQAVRLRNMTQYDGRDLTSDVADVRIDYGGSATVRVQDELRVTINGSGSVYYIGDPIVESSINGSGELVQIGG